MAVKPAVADTLKFKADLIASFIRDFIPYEDDEDGTAEHVLCSDLSKEYTWVKACERIFNLEEVNTSTLEQLFKQFGFDLQLEEDELVQIQGRLELINSTSSPDVVFIPTAQCYNPAIDKHCKIFKVGEVFPDGSHPYFIMPGVVALWFKTFFSHTFLDMSELQESDSFETIKDALALLVSRSLELYKTMDSAMIASRKLR